MTDAATALRLDAIVLAGGRSNRLGGTAKAVIELDGARLVDRTIAAAHRAGARTVVVVGPDEIAPVRGARLTREQPVFGGPVAGLVAGLAALPSGASETADDSGATGEPGEWVLVLSCDLISPESAAGPLLRRLASRHLDGDPIDGVVIDDGRTQWLAAVYRRTALERAASRLGDPANRAMRELLGGLDLERLIDDGTAAADIDTWEDVERAGRARRRETGPRTHSESRPREDSA